MNKRDLKADLELCAKLKGIHESQRSHAQTRKLDAIKLPEMTDIASHAIERALDAEELVRELVQELENVVCFIETMEYRHVSVSVGKDFVGYKCGDGNSYWIGDILGDIEIMINKAKVAGCQHIFEDITSLSEATQGVERSMCAQCGHEVLKYVSTKEVLGDE